MRLNDTLIDHVVLALIAESPQHGFAIARTLANDPELSAAVSISRPLVYRSIDTLSGDGLIASHRTEPGTRGTRRVVYRITPRGTRINDDWLDAIVDTPRDARVDLVTKFILRSRRGLANRALAKRQMKHFAPLSKRLSTDEGSGLVAMWRQETLDATMRALARIAG